MIRLNCSAPALADRDEMHDRLDSFDGPAEAGGVGDVPSSQLAAPGGELGGATRVTDEAADRQLAAAQLVDDVPAHEARAAGDEDHPAGSL